MKRDPSAEPVGRLAGIDALRFAAALMVAIFHLGYWSWAATGTTSASILARRAGYPELIDLSWWGWVGVHIFFVISGFVIAFSASHATPGQFLQGRILRLFPGALACATITLAVAVAIGWKPLQDLLGMYARSIFFWPDGPWIDGVYWTLGIEISFYAVVFALLAAGRLRWLEGMMIAVGVLSISACLFWFIFVSHISEPRLPGISQRITDLALARHGAYFAIGTLLWAGAYSGWTATRVTATVFLVIGGLLPIASETFGKLRHDASIGSVLSPAIVWLVAVAALFAAVTFRRQVEQLLTPATVSSLKWLGLSTYPLYLLHDVVGTALLGRLIDLGIGRYTALALALIAIVALSLVVTMTVERWLRLGLRGLLRSGNWRVAAKPA